MDLEMAAYFEERSRLDQEMELIKNSSLAC